MGTTISVRFPLGRYHATPWDGGANTSDVEWPPSPWRLLRALLATWHTRWPELPVSETERIIRALGTPIAYFTPPTSPSSSRHYMPDLRHNRAEHGNTDQVLDAFLAINPEKPLRIHWATDVSSEDRETLAKVVELMPYLGRSESVCIAKLDEDDPAVDASWWRLGDTTPGVHEVRLLAPEPGVTREQLEVTTVATRKARRLLPEGARWVSYGCLGQIEAPVLRSRSDLGVRMITCLAFDLLAPVPVRAGNAVLAADAMHDAVSAALSGHGDADEVSALLGRAPDNTPRRAQHDHLHVLPLPSARRRRALLAAGAPIERIYLYAPLGMSDAVAGRLQVRARKLWTRSHLTDEMRDQRLLVAGAGQPDELLPDLCAASTTWTSLVPYLPVRHRHRAQSPTEWLMDDVAHECAYRGYGAPRVVELLDDDNRAKREITQYRRRRTDDRLDKLRPGVFLRLRFDEPISGPLILGQLSHFGYGIFTPPQPASAV